MTPVQKYILAEQALVRAFSEGNDRDVEKASDELMAAWSAMSTEERQKIDAGCTVLLSRGPEAGDSSRNYAQRNVHVNPNDHQPSRGTAANPQPAKPEPQREATPYIGLYGWLCPRCGRGVSPMQPSCPCAGQDLTITSGDLP